MLGSLTPEAWFVVIATTLVGYIVGRIWNYEEHKNDGDPWRG
jgi:hypothetical protein